MSFYNGLSLLLFHQDAYQAEYGCTNIAASTTPVPSNTHHPVLSIVQLILAIVSEILYAFCMLSIRKHLQIPCYKILFFIGIVDMLGLVVGAILCSVMALTGATFCDFPLTQYISGGLAMAFWFAETTSEFILAFNRCMELLVPGIAVSTFKERRTLYLLGLPTVYALFSWLFTRPVIFSTTKFAFFFSPYEDYSGATAASNYSNMMHTFNNTLVSCVLCATYGLFCLIWVGRMLKMNAMANPSAPMPTTTATTTVTAMRSQQKGDGDNKNNTNIVIIKGISDHRTNGNSADTNCAAAGGGSSIAVKMTFLQVVLISLFNSCAAGLGVYMEHFETHAQMVVAAQFTYVLTHAAPPFIYLACNRTIRADIGVLLGRRPTGDGQIGGRTVPTHTQSVPNGGHPRGPSSVPPAPQPTFAPADYLSVLNNGVPLFRRAISGTGSDAPSGGW